MQARRLKEMTDRQFQRVLAREGKEVFNPITLKKYTVLFREVRSTSGESISIYYTYDTDLKKGDIVEYKGFRYILTTESSIQSDSFKVSVLKRCTVLLNIYGRRIPMAILTSLNLGVVTTENLGLVTTDTDDIRSLERNSQYICFGSMYKVSNIFFNDGMAYVYMKRVGDAVYGLKEIKYYGSNTYSLEDGKVLLPFTVVTTIDDVVWTEAEITYTVSSNELAEVDANGYMTMKKRGVVTVTATCEGIYLKKTITIK
jgi:hypothetical protein